MHSISVYLKNTFAHISVDKRIYIHVKRYDMYAANLIGSYNVYVIWKNCSLCEKVNGKKSYYISEISNLCTRRNVYLEISYF